MAGYSGTLLPRKLGVKANHRVLLVEPPLSFVEGLGELPANVRFETDTRGQPFDVVLFFAITETDLTKRFQRMAKGLQPTGGLWIAWPKKAGGVEIHLTESVVRGVGLAAGLVDNKVCAVDDVWSGLRFVVRLKDRVSRGRSRNP